MTEEQVRDAFLSHAASSLIASYPALQTAGSIERAGQFFSEEIPFVVATLHKYEHVWPSEDQWEFLVQFSKSTHQDENTTAVGAIEADQDMRVALQAAVNGNAGYLALRNAGLYSPTLKAMSEDQRDMTLINPHIFSCSTF